MKMDINQYKLDGSIILSSNAKVTRYSSESFKKGLELAKKIEKSNVNNQCQHWFEYGKSLYDLGDYEEAVTYSGLQPDRRQ